MAIRRRLGRRAAAPRRLTDWEANSPQSFVPVVTLDGVTSAQVLFPRSVLGTAGPRSTLTRMLLELGVRGVTVGANTIVHMAIAVVSLDSTGSIQFFDPTNVADLNKGLILWQRQVFLLQGIDGFEWYRESIDIKAQRKLQEDNVIAFFIEPNGAAAGTINHHIGGRCLLKLA